MPRVLGLVSCTLIGEGASGLDRQCERLRAVSDIVRGALTAEDGACLWLPCPGGGHAAFALPSRAGAALGLLIELRSWSRRANVPLRLAAHAGEVETVEGPDGRPQPAGPGIDLAQRLLSLAGPGRVVVTDTFRAAAGELSVPGARFHDEAQVEPEGFPAVKLSLLSTDEFTSAWDAVEADDRVLLKEASRKRAAWEAIYHARRLLQVNAGDRDALDALAGLREQDLTARNPATGEEEKNAVLWDMDRPSRIDFLRAAQLVERGPGELLCKYQDEGDTMFVILRGRIEVVIPGGTTRSPIRFEAGQIVGELAFALHRKRTASLRCLDRTALLGFSYQQLRAVLQDSPFRGRIEEKVERFLRTRILRYVCDSVPYLVGKDRSGPLARLTDPWEYLLDEAQVLDCTWKESPVISREAASFQAPGLYLLVSGALQDAADPARRLDGNDLPILYADLPGLPPDGGRRYHVEADVRVLRIGRAAFESRVFERDVFRGLLEGIKKALAGPAVRAAAAAGDEAFSSQTVLIHYPAPVALAYQRFCQQREPVGRLDRLFKALEATLRYLTLLGVADLLHCLAAPGRPAAELPAHSAFDFLRRPVKMTLGKWVEALRETCRALAREEGRFVVELPGVCRPGGHFDSRVLGWIVANRNVAEHVEGSIPLGPQECREMVGQVRPRLEEAFQLLHFLRQYPLGFITEGVSAGTGPHRYYVRSCMGARLAEEAYGVDATARLAPETVFVLAPDGGRLLYLWPLVCARVGEQTGQHTLFLFERLREHGAFLGKVRWAAIDQRVGWEQDLHEPEPGSHAWLLERLRQLPAVVDLPADLRLAEGLLPSRGGRLVGKKLGGNRLVGVIASGGFGTVYAAESPDGRRVAVKVIEVRERIQQYARFRQEFEKLRRAGQYPGIIRCFELGSELIKGRDYPWYSMEYAAGGDLGGRLRERRGAGDDTLPWDDPALREEIIGEFRAVVEAAANLHRLDVVHRDLKPGNVLIMEDGELRLSDFGLVKALGTAEGEGGERPRTSTGAVLGTRCYMAPEQEHGEAVDRTADVYSLGVMLAELATGSRPEPDGRAAQGSTLQKSPLLLRLPPALAQFIGRCTDVAPERRPANAGVVQEEFGKVVAGL